MSRFLASILLSASLLIPSVFGATASPRVVQWGIFELSLNGPSTGNPFIEVEITARFIQGDRAVKVAGFYDGDGLYRVRFSPETLGEWHYVTASNRVELNGHRGSFIALAPDPGNRGPLRVHNTHHFAYADGTPFRQIGTTCYAWIHQGDGMAEQTLQTLANSPFNKLRMCVFPKRYGWNENEPELYPFEGQPLKGWDFTRFNPAFFRNLERRVGQLRDLGIEADIILFHPYDEGHWGFDRMAAGDDDRYLRYVLARLSAYRNVWWSLANEFDLMREKTTEDWDRFFRIVVSDDPHARLRSIHNASRFYNYNHPWVTHVSIQNGASVAETGRAVLYRDLFRKPLVYDEVGYEGNLPRRWGNLSAEEMVHRFWVGTVGGTYVGHGETYRHPEDLLWWAKGGVLRGESPARLAFLRAILEKGPRDGHDTIDRWFEFPFAGKAGEYYLGYLGRETATEWPFVLFRAGLQDGMKFEVEVIDAWNMTITPVAGVFEILRRDDYYFADKDGRGVPLPGRPYQGLRIRRIP